ncbi:hypothetical protein C8N43_2389 [Litoreibacter ponti]|uniref:Sulfotransferase domain-containing protein n=1 Tax=Litoreibacter ponti TaxID=1510457 RepID=A0A2T6BNR2_9RHOB|nr:hypothetical protein [Litoreibacter ponti]PTX57718.1 hypothetical protein C8N43_2389 [Litoreibacter ponti]
MSKLVLHIGTHKTATTTIQRSLHLNRTEAFKAGLVYPDLPRQHHGLVADWIRLPEFYHYPAGAKAHWQHITKVNSGTDRTVLISTEELSRGTPDNQVNFSELRELVAAFDEVEVVCFLRDQLSLIQSIFFEVFRKHGKLGWNNYLALCFRDRLATGVFLDYGKLYDLLLTHFSEDEITFLPFRPSGQAVSPLNALLSHIGFSNLIGKIKQEDANRSAEPLATWLSVLINHPDGFDADLATTILPLFDGKKTSMYTSAEAKRVVDFFEPLNAAFLERYPGLTASDLAMQQPLEDEYFFRDQVRTPVWIELARLMRNETS